VQSQDRVIGFKRGLNRGEGGKVETGGKTLTLRAGDWVEVRSKQEILRSLDKQGSLDGLPFMPQMFEYCGKRFRVFKRAHKTCDTVNPVAGRRLDSAVHLELRCNGKAYGGCQAACLIFWKEAWLKPIGKKTNMVQSSRADATVDQVGCSEDDVWQATCVRNPQGDDEIKYTCQATQLPYFTAPLAWWNLRQYVEDYVSGNVTLKRIVCGFVYRSYYELFAKRGNKVGRPARWLYDRFQTLVGGVPFPLRRGSIPTGQPTPVVNLNLQPGELVRVKSYEEILATLDGLKNRGMYFDAELVPYCGRVYRVRARVTNFINEKTGKMSTMKTPAIILEGVYCQSRYSDCRMFCPRSIYSWWREIWLERVSENALVDSHSIKTFAVKYD
jgi:hypothetical protein